MTKTGGMPVGAGVRERLRAAQRAESAAISAVQKALAAEAEAQARLDAIIVKHRSELSAATQAVRTAQAGVVRTSGLERAAVLLDVPARVLRSAVRETAPDTTVEATRVQDAGDQDTRIQGISDQDISSKTPVATTAPTIAPAKT